MKIREIGLLYDIKISEGDSAKDFMMTIKRFVRPSFYSDLNSMSVYNNLNTSEMYLKPKLLYNCQSVKLEIYEWFHLPVGAKIEFSISHKNLKGIITFVY